MRTYISFCIFVYLFVCLRNAGVDLAKLMRMSTANVPLIHVLRGFVQLIHQRF